MKNMVVNEFHGKIFLKNCLGELSNSSFQRRTHDCSESYPAIHLRGLSSRILSEIGIMFSRKKTFCFENSVFSHLAKQCFLTLGLGMREGVSEGLRSGKG